LFKYGGINEIILYGLEVRGELWERKKRNRRLAGRK
jgi:hypothetical protein